MTSQVLKEEFKDHFRNVTHIMDCVGCDKCRLWGKVQTTGVGTALKDLFELDERTLECVYTFVDSPSFVLSNLCSPRSNPNLLSCSEVFALINTLHRFTESLYYVDVFREMWAETEEQESQQLLREAEDAVAGHVRFGKVLAEL